MRRLVIACAYLCVFSCLRSPQAVCEPLDMTAMAFDDEYVNCIKEMEANITSAGLLEVEKSKDPNFGGAWDKAASEWEERKKRKLVPPLPVGFQDNHAIAILIYTDKNFPSSDASLPSRFNEAVRTSVLSREGYMSNFTFKALHFYLTTGLQLFKTSCRQVYRGIRRAQFEPSAGSEKGIRFGQFTSSSVSPETAEHFGNDSYLNITTCYGVDIEKFSYDPSEKEVLIPPNEIFYVSSFTEEGHRFVLKSTKSRCHFYNCAYLGGEKSPNCIFSSASSAALLISSPRYAQLVREFVISAAVLGLFVNL
ncbi:ecto-ADP-ribosyltransferase 5-like [Ambystoma mexicanum]|uniref:ecto-ADP-ribosyltransferase 5-like n=1 Tax=Ambystoma mexicanum TaxID=8296 RepID=UPI0037E80F64